MQSKYYKLSKSGIEAKLTKIHYFIKIIKILNNMLCYIIIKNNETLSILLRFLIFKVYNVWIAFPHKYTYWTEKS